MTAHCVDTDSVSLCVCLPFCFTILTLCVSVDSVSCLLTLCVLFVVYPGLLGMVWKCTAIYPHFVPLLSCSRIQLLVYEAAGRYRFQGSKRFRGHTNAGYAILPGSSTDGRFVMSGDGTGKVLFWDWKTMKNHRTLHAHDQVCMGSEWHPTMPSRVRVWRVTCTCMKVGVEMFIPWRIGLQLDAHVLLVWIVYFYINMRGFRWYLSKGIIQTHIWAW